MLSFVRRKELNRNRFKCRQSTWGRGGRWWGEGRRREGQREGKGKKGGSEGERERRKKEGREETNRQAKHSCLQSPIPCMPTTEGASFHIRTNYQRP